MTDVNPTTNEQIPWGPLFPTEEPVVRTGGFRRNRLWYILAGFVCLSGVVIGILFAIASLYFSSIRSWDAYRLAMDFARKDVRASIFLGGPVEHGWTVFGQFGCDPNRQVAFLRIPVRGTLHRGIVLAKATLDREKWRLNYLVIERTDPAQRFNLVDSNFQTRYGHESAPISWSELDSHVRALLSADTVNIRSGVEDVFLLAEGYLQKQNSRQAIRYYTAALAVDAWRPAEQLKLAWLLADQGDFEQAGAKARFVLEQSTDSRFRREAQSLIELSEKKSVIAKEPSVSAEDPVHILLVPIGPIDIPLIRDLLPLLSEATGIQYVLSDQKLEPGNPDRNSAEHELQRVVESIQQKIGPDRFEGYLGAQGILPNEIQTQTGKKRLIQTYLLQNKVPLQEVESYFSRVEDLQTDSQYDASRILGTLESRFPFPADGSVIGYLGVTSADLYAKDFNYLFGWAGDRYGVLSYHRFRPEFNGEKPEGSALKDRTFKQLLSSTLRVLGISKCSTPDCAAAYPNSLDEHDRKGTRLCPRCKQQIQTAVRRHRQTGRGIPEAGK